MANELFFIPRIAAALREHYTFGALADAFADIIRRGRLPAYAEGFAQFVAFMVGVAEGTCDRQLGPLEDAMANEAMFELAIGTPGQDALHRHAAAELIRSRPEWVAQFSSLDQSTLAGTPELEQLTLSLALDSQILATRVFSENAPVQSVIAPQAGHYSLSLHTGRLMWEGVLSEAELHWTTARPGHPLRLAASTFEETNWSSRAISILNGEIILSVFPGLEYGRIEIRVGRAGEESP